MKPLALAGTLTNVIDNATQNVIERIHASGRQLVLSITGGGSGAIASLLEVPGGSASLVEAIVPYAATSLDEWLGGSIDQYCSERTARAMAMSAFQRARTLVGDQVGVLRGIGATASLSTSRPKRGPHRIHAAWQSADTTAVVSCQLAKDQRTRAEEEHIATQIVLGIVAEACGVAWPNRTAHESCGSFQRRIQQATPEWTSLLLGERATVAVGELPGADRPFPKILFPGAFNPFHQGHARMADVAGTILGQPVTLELSVANVDKPPLDFIEIADRLTQLAGRPVLLTCAPTFVEKAQLAPGCVFVVGIDTLVRIADPRYYSGDAQRRDAVIASIAEEGCRFLVFGRVSGDQFLTLSQSNLPPALAALCEEVPESVFRDDISSTYLRPEV